MKVLFMQTKRTVKLFFKDKGMFLSSLITPLILLVLYATFLAKIYKDSFTANLPAALNVSEALIDGTVGGELVSSILAVACITVAFCSNLLMVQDKVTGVRKDFLVTPVKKATLAVSYFLTTLICTLIVTYVATGACFIYLAAKGWFLSVGDVFLLLLDVFLLTLFGTSLSSVVNVFLNSQGQSSAVGTIVSAGYGFICGAYMPISNFGEGLQKVLSFLPGTYGTSIIRNHALAGVFREMTDNYNFPAEVVEKIKDSVDCNLYFFGDKVSMGAMYGILCGSIVVLIAAYILINVFYKPKTLAKPKKNKKTK